MAVVYPTSRRLIHSSAIIRLPFALVLITVSCTWLLLHLHISTLTDPLTGNYDNDWRANRCRLNRSMSVGPRARLYTAISVGRSIMDERAPGTPARRLDGSQSRSGRCEDGRKLLPPCRESNL
jgi:hypothetical protein